MMGKLYARIWKLWRRKRAELFLKRMRPSPTDTLLDVGGFPYFWLDQPQMVDRIDTINVHPVEWDAESHPEHRIRCLVGDGRSLEMRDETYDIAFSNSVIEHVGTWEDQERFAAEIRRVASDLWVQTPAYGCPVEPHYMAPFVHWFPRGIQRRVIRYVTIWGWLSRPTQEKIDRRVDSTRLIRRSEMERLFPDCEIYTERLLWLLPKSYIAIRITNA